MVFSMITILKSLLKILIKDNDFDVFLKTSQFQPYGLAFLV